MLFPQPFDLSDILADRHLREATLGSYRVEIVHIDGTCNYLITKTRAEAVQVARQFVWGMRNTDYVRILEDQDAGAPIEYGPWGPPRGWQRLYGRVRLLMLGCSQLFRYPKRQFRMLRFKWKQRVHARRLASHPPSGKPNGKALR